MSKKLAYMLGKTEAEMTHIINKLESKSGYQSVDVRLLAEYNLQLKAKIADLGLDPADTTNEELQAALASKYTKDASLIDKSIGATGLGAEQKVRLGLKLLDHLVKSAEVWIAKPSVIKNLIKQNPPKKTLKFLNYRSLDSMLKRVDSGEILYIANALEPASWHKNLNQKIAKLPSSSFELRRAKIVLTEVNLPDANFAAAEKNSGTVLLNPAKLEAGVPVLSVCLSVLEELEDLSLRCEFESLHKINPALNWWANTGHLLVGNDGQPVSFNIKDVAKVHAGQSSSNHGASQLWNKLLDTYKEKINELPEELSQVEEKVEGQLSAPVRELAAETVEI